MEKKGLGLEGLWIWNSLARPIQREEENALRHKVCINYNSVGKLHSFSPKLSVKNGNLKDLSSCQK